MDRSPGHATREAVQAEVYLLAHMGHSLRTPLNQVLGFSELLSEQLSGPLNEKQQSQAEGIARAGERLLRVVDDLLLLGRLSSGLVAIEPGNVDPAEVAKGVLLSIEPIDGVPVRAEPQRTGAVSLALDSYWLECLLNALIRPLRELSAPDDDVVVQLSRPGDGSSGLSIEVSATMGDHMNAPEGCDLVQFAVDCERLVHGTGVQLLLAEKIVAIGGGALCLETEGTHGSSYALRCTIPQEAKHTEQNPQQLVGAATS